MAELSHQPAIEPSECLQSESLAPFRRTPYASVKPETEEIRLIELESQHDDPIQIKLVHVNLADDPQYEALSYVWGTEMSSRKTFVNGKPVSITANLHCALRHLRPTSGKRILWVDALCINQDDVQERNHQVQLMGKIYSQAQDVIIWLGPDNDAKYEAMNCIKFGFISYLRADGQEAQNLRAALVEIFEQPWFSRVWVVQELTLARRDPEVHLGSHSVPWSALVGFSREVQKSYEASGSRKLAALYDAALRLWALDALRAAGPTTNFAICLKRTAFCSSTDPRDRVFGLLGISTFSSMPIVADYSKTVQRVFAESMAALIQDRFAHVYDEHPLRRLCSDDDQYSNQTPGLPSWVIDPDSSERFSRKAFIANKLYHMPGDRVARPVVLDQILSRHPPAPLVRFSKDFTTMQTAGAHIGIVCATSGDLFFQKREIKTRIPLLSPSTLYQIYTTIVKPRAIPPEHLLEALAGANKADNPFWDDSLSTMAFELLLMDWFDPFSWKDGRMTKLPYEELLYALGPSTHMQTLFVTKKGHVGMSYHPDPCNGIRKGDLVVGLFGINFPFILRRIGDNYEMINVAHVANHKWGHKFLQNAPPDIDWKEFEKFGLKEYSII